RDRAGSVIDVLRFCSRHPAAQTSMRADLSGNANATSDSRSEMLPVSLLPLHGGARFLAVCRVLLRPPLSQSTDVYPAERGSFTLPRFGHLCLASEDPSVNSPWKQFVRRDMAVKAPRDTH